MNDNLRRQMENDKVYPKKKKNKVTKHQRKLTSEREKLLFVCIIR